MSQTKLYYMNQIISLVTLSLLWEVINTFGQFDQKDLTRKTNFWGVLLVQVQ